ncbi:MAG: HEPN domain-containing protein [Oscillospiraceae bacterium]|nr:HEPN domain-containing protein [Oscillospiraceae bacterium]
MRPIPLEIVCYHCQQSVEKIIKAFLIYSRVKPEKTHDLESLNDRCKIIDKSFKKIDEKCIRLNAYSSQPRYPFEIEIEESHALLALNDSKEINEFIKEKIII